ncbi:MAG: DUF3854 domain-containing protein [Acidobacteriota bacterium]|nr:DUF3854 domain-containing protein [Acidobacteriota bacterium]
MNGLTETDYSNLRSSFITPEIAAAAKLRRVSDAEGAETTGRPRKAGTNYVGIVFPYFLPPNYDCPREYRLRRDCPDYEQKPDGTLKEKGKYLSPPGARNMLYFPPDVQSDWLTDVSLPVAITEGEKKTLGLYQLSRQNAAESSEPRFLPVGLSGVWNWRGSIGKTTNADGGRTNVKGVISDFNLIEWNGRTVFIVFDQNVNTNESVKTARRELAKELKGRGANVLIVELPEIESINGVDDLLGLWERKHGAEEATRRCFELFNKAKVFDDKEKPNQATRILRFAEHLELFHTSDQETFATVEIDGHEENHRLNTKAFRSWLSFHFFKTEGQMPSTQALQDAVGTLEGKAMFEGEEREVFVRLAAKDGRIYLDLCNETWQIVEIDKSGWRVIESVNAPVRFRRTKAMLPLPMPYERGGDITRIRQFLNVSDANYVLIMAWLANCFRPDYPFPVLILSGEQGSAKSTTSRLLRELVDPNKTAFRSAPRDERDLVIAASNAWICAFDNLSSVPNWLSDALCRISTGGGFATRTLYENEEETIFAAKRPILINGIGDLANRSDLLDRALLVHLETIPEDKRKTESQFWSEFEREKANIFSGLLSAVSSALQNVENVKLERLPRMADFAEWSAAAENGLRLPADSFLNAYTRNRDNVNETALEGLPLADTVKTFCDKTDEFKGTMKEFLGKLNTIADDETKKSKEYPKTERGLRSKLERINPNLRAIGIDIKFLGKSDKGRLLKLEYKCKQPSETSESSGSPQNGDKHADDEHANRQSYRQTVSQSSANGHSANSYKSNGFADKSNFSDDSDGHLHSHSETEKFCNNCGAAVESYHKNCRSCGELPLGI